MKRPRMIQSIDHKIKLFVVRISSFKDLIRTALLIGLRKRKSKEKIDIFSGKPTCEDLECWFRDFICECAKIANVTISVRHIYDFLENLLPDMIRNIDGSTPRQELTSSEIAQTGLQNSVSVYFGPEDPLELDGGSKLSPYTIAYQTYGTLNSEKNNAVLVYHALTGDQHVASTHPITGKSGWWNTMIGPGRSVDTNVFFVICANIIGGCMGSTGPSSNCPDTGKPYGLNFPVITIKDMVRAQMRLIDRLEIPDLFCVIGGSMGGMLVLQCAASYPDRVFSAIPIATTSRHSSQNIAFHEVGRQAVMADPEWHGGRYLAEGANPRKGLAVARMAAHITYLSDEALHNKFGRTLQDREKLAFGFDADFQVESYLRHQGYRFVDRFDANSYLYITRAMDYFDLPSEYGGVLANAFRNTKTRFCVVSFTSDWLYPTKESRNIVQALNAVAANVSFVEIASDKGHDAFLLEEPEMFQTVSGFINAAAAERGIAGTDRSREHDEETAR